jgi:phosphoglycerate dehydrogenase-like enzyme
MNTMKIFSDTPLSDLLKTQLEEGAAPAEILFSKTSAASILAKAEADPAFSLADIAFGQPDLESIEKSDRLKWVHVSSAGFTRYDTPEFRVLAAARGLVVSNSSSVYAAPCAEHVFSFMLGQSRGLPQCLASHAANGAPGWHRLRQSSVSLRGQSVVILGFGAIARELMKLLGPFAMQLTAMRRSPRGDEGIPTVKPADLSGALATADHVINILPDNPASRGFIDDSFLASMKAGAVFYNIGRGTTVNQSALLDSLRSGHLAAAWLDVTEPEPLPADHPLRAEPNCFITPHTAGGHRNEEGSLIRHFLANLAAFRQGLPLADRIM